MPQFSTDDVTDYMVREAIVAKAQHERKQQEAEEKKRHKRDEWRKGHQEWAKEMGLVG